MKLLSRDEGTTIMWLLAVAIQNAHIAIVPGGRSRFIALVKVRIEDTATVMAALSLQRSGYH